MAEYFVTIDERCYPLIQVTSKLYGIDDGKARLRLDEIFPKTLEYWKLKGVIHCEEESKT